MKIYTRGGDMGETSLIGERVKKNDLRVEAYGTVDELNSFLGLVISFGGDEKLKNIQEDLYVISAELAGGEQKISHDEITELENWIDSIELPELKSFLRPGGSKLASFLHVARTVCRRAERKVVSINVREEVISYLNRLSDLLFVLAREANEI
jgi:cob(I)alamin adenosyltransferase